MLGLEDERRARESGAWLAPHRVEDEAGRPGFGPLLVYREQSTANGDHQQAELSIAQGGVHSGAVITP